MIGIDSCVGIGVYGVGVSIVIGVVVVVRYYCVVIVNVCCYC